MTLKLARAQNALPTMLLLGVTAVWGWTFLIVKDAVRSYPATEFLALRFALAGAFMIPLLLTVRRRQKGKTDPKHALMLGCGIGLMMALGYFFQTEGLRSTSAANAGLLTGLLVVLTPVIDQLIYSAPVPRVTRLAVCGGFIGTGLLTLAGATGPSFGDVLEVATAVCFALQIVWLGRFAHDADPTLVAFGQIGMAAIAFVVLLPVESPRLEWPSPFVWFALLVTAGLATTVAFWIQTWAQTIMPPSRVAIVLLGEPAFAAGFAVWLGGERLSAIQWIGAAMILGSLAGHELWTLWNVNPRGKPASAAEV